MSLLQGLACTGAAAFDAGMRILAALLCFSNLLCFSTLLAQAKPDPLRYVPRDADAVVRVVGPAAWRRDFAATGLGKAFGDQQMAPIWDRLLKYFATTFEFRNEALGEPERQRFETLWSDLRDYSGDIVFAGRLDWDVLDLNANQFPGAAVLAMAGDGKVDMAKLLEKITAMMPDAGGRELQVGSVLAPLRELGGVELAGPFAHEGHLLLVFGHKLEERASWFFEERAGVAETKDLRDAAMTCRFRLSGFVDALFEAIDLGVAPWQAKLLELIGVRALQELSFSIYADGKYVGQQMQLKLGAASRGLIDAVVPVRSKRPDLLRYLPAGAASYTAAPMDVAALRRVYEQGMAGFADDLPVTREELEGRFTELTRVDLFKDIVAHIGDEYLRIDDLDAEGEYDEDDPDAVAKAKDRFGDSCFVIKLRDGRALAKSLDTMIRARGLHVGRKREDYDGTNIYRMNLLGMFSIEYAVTDSLFVLGVGGGEGTQQNLRGVLDAVASIAKGDGATPLAKEVKTRLEGMPADWCGLQVASFVELLDGITGGFESLEAMFAEEGVGVEDLDESWRLIFDASKAIKPVLARYGAGVTVNVDYYQKDRYVMRSRW